MRAVTMIITTLAFSAGATLPSVIAAAEGTVPLAMAKLNLEYNATDNDIGFQGMIDSNGWKELVISGPDGPVLKFQGLGKLANHGVTELFFETVEPSADTLPIAKVLSVLPEGNYKIEGTAMVAGKEGGKTSGEAWLTHAIPAGPKLRTPAAKAVVPADELRVSWDPVTKTITGADVKIIAYQLIVEKDEKPHRHMIGKRGLSMYLPATVTEITLPKGFLEKGTGYNWEVLAIEESGNQTIALSAFRTK
jgi:hypothetical protein